MMLTMMNDNDIASKVKAIICSLFVCGQIIVLIIYIRLNSQDPIFSTPLVGCSTQTGRNTWRHARWTWSVTVWEVHQRRRSETAMRTAAVDMTHDVVQLARALPILLPVCKCMCLDVWFIRTSAVNCQVGVVWDYVLYFECELKP